MTVVLKCTWCAVKFDKCAAEMRRRLREGHSQFFCSRSCGAQWSNKDRRAQPIELVCQNCGATFKTTTGSKSAKKFCSKSCTSTGKVTPYQRHRAAETGRRNCAAMHLPVVRQRGMQTREGRKYAELAKKLGNDAEFEFPLPGTKYLFDMAWRSRKLLVEFDGPDHAVAKTKIADAKKDRAANKQGWQVVRVPTTTNAVIPTSVLKSVLKRILQIA